MYNRKHVELLLAFAVSPEVAPRLRHYKSFLLELFLFLLGNTVLRKVAQYYIVFIPARGSRLHPQALLTDMYQITMTYAYWKAGRHEEDVRSFSHA